MPSFVTVCDSTWSSASSSRSVLAASRKAKDSAAKLALQIASGLTISRDAALCLTNRKGRLPFSLRSSRGSAQLLQHLGERYVNVVGEHRRLLRAALQDAGGYEVDAAGDGFFYAFVRAGDAVRAAVAVQRAITGHPWPEGATVRVAIALHTGEATIDAGGYVGLNVHRTARICAAGWGGQILLSQDTYALIEHDLPAGVSARNLGEHRLKDLQRREQIYEILHPDLPADFPPLRSLDTLPNNLPHQLTSFIGREREMAEVKHLLTSTRLLTLTGPGGCGKTRLALQVGANLLEEFANGVWLVEPAAVNDPTLVPQAVASTWSLREEPGRALLATLGDYLKRKHMLLLLDNCEHLLVACADLAASLLETCPNLKILAISWEPLGIVEEVRYRVPPLSLPDPLRLPSPEQLMQYETVRLFTERAADALPTFKVTDQNALAVAQVCRQLDGIPLAIELAAARVKVLSVERIAERLDDTGRLRDRLRGRERRREREEAGRDMRKGGPAPPGLTQQRDRPWRGVRHTPRVYRCSVRTAQGS